MIYIIYEQKYESTIVRFYTSDQNKASQYCEKMNKTIPSHRRYYEYYDYEEVKPLEDN